MDWQQVAQPKHNQKRQVNVPSVDIERVATLMREVADQVIMPRWRNLAAHEIGHKARPNDIVTIADREAEALLTRHLGDLLPGSHVIGEEAVSADPRLLQLFRSPEPVWVIDPIDGTRKFTEGQPIFDVMVALVQNGKGVAGWIYAPAENDFYMGEAGSGVVRRQGKAAAIPVRPPPRTALPDLMGIVTSQGFLNRKLQDPEVVRSRFRGFTRHTCAGHNYARLLKGECDFLINLATLPWDHLPGLTLAAEAGFHQARLDGAGYDPLDQQGGILVAPNGASWRDIRAELFPGS